LRWWDLHGQDPALVLLGKRPTSRMNRLMAREGQLVRIPRDRWLLTQAGRDVLATRRQRRKKKSDATAEQKDREHRDAGEHAPAADR
jgi:hypothetical protein